MGHLKRRSVTIGVLVVLVTFGIWSSLAYANGRGTDAKSAPGIVTTNSPLADSLPLLQFVSQLPNPSQLDALVTQQRFSASVNGESVPLVNLGAVAANIERHYAEVAVNTYAAKNHGSLPKGAQLTRLASAIPSQVTLLREALSYRVFEAAVFHVAKANDKVVPLKTVRDEQERNWLRAQQVAKQGGPKTPRSMYLGSRALRGMQRALTVMQQENAIGGILTQNGSRTATFRNWLDKELSDHAVSLHVSSHYGTESDRTVAALLPPGM